MSLRLGYLWGPQIDTPITGSLVLYPAGQILDKFLNPSNIPSTETILATVITFFFFVVLAPVIAIPNSHAVRIVRLTAVASFVASASALILMIVSFDKARKRFLSAGFSAEFGPLVRALKISLSQYSD